MLLELAKLTNAYKDWDAEYLGALTRWLEGIGLIFVAIVDQETAILLELCVAVAWKPRVEVVQIYTHYFFLSLVLKISIAIWPTIALLEK